MNEPADKLKTDDAVRVVAELTRVAQGVDMAYLMMGKLLAHVKEHELFKYYSEHTQTMSAFLREIDLGIGMSQADHYIRIYKTFGEKMEGRKIAFKRLLLIHPLCKDEPTTHYLLDQAEKLPLKALGDEIRERQGKTPTDACEHPLEARECVYRCRICSQWLKEGK
jgi:hypothetical protein